MFRELCFLIEKKSLFKRLDCPMWAGLDTLLTTDALVGVDDFGVFVERKNHIPEDLLRASVHTLPASLASMRVKLDVSCLLQLSESFLSSASMRQGMERCHYRECPHTDEVKGSQAVSPMNMEHKTAHDCSSQCTCHYFCIWSHIDCVIMPNYFLMNWFSVSGVSALL